jgi:hypothetical protein
LQALTAYGSMHFGLNRRRSLKFFAMMFLLHTDEAPVAASLLMFSIFARTNRHDMVDE